MLIGIYSPYLDTLTGGEKYIFTAASCLSGAHEVEILWDDPFILSKAAAKFDLDASRIKVAQNPFKPSISTLSRILMTHKYDRLLYLSDGSIPIVGSKKLFIHFQFPVEWVKKGRGLFSKLKESRISKVICNSYYTKGFIDTKFGVDSIVLYPPADINARETPEKENLILTVGRYSKLSNGTDFKKLGILVKAFKEFKKKRLKGWKFAIVTSVVESEEKGFQEFEKTITSEDIKLYKNVPRVDLIGLFAKAKIYWHAAGFGEDLEKHPEWAEHFGISTVEAMSYGAVPLVIDAGGQKEIVSNGSNGYLWRNIEELVKLTHKVALEPMLMKNLADSAVQLSHNFSKERFCEELNHII